MKLSIVVSTQPASFSALAYKGKITENIIKIKNYGFDGVELAVRDPKLLDIFGLQTVLAKANLPVSAIGTGQAYGEEKLSFTNPDEAMRRQAIERIQSQVQLAEQFQTIVILGLIRGKVEVGINKNRALELLISAIRDCATVNKNIKLVIEPINRYETDLVNTVIEGMDLLDKVKLENVGLLLDTFHMNIEEADMCESIYVAKDRLFHFHVADSNRRYPGAGHINFMQILETLEKITFRGFISAEILPLPDSDTAAQKTKENMSRLIGKNS